MTGTEQQANIGPQLDCGEAVAGILGLHELSDQVILRLAAPKFEQRLKRSPRTRRLQRWRHPSSSPRRRCRIQQRDAGTHLDDETKTVRFRNASSSQITSTGKGKGEVPDRLHPTLRYNLVQELVGDVAVRARAMPRCVWQ